MSNQYETTFILNPVLSQEQLEAAIEEYRTLLKNSGAGIVFENNWGLRKLAYPIQKKATGFYYLIEFTSDDADIIGKLEIEYKRDERVMRFLTIKLDKDAVTYNEKKRSNAALKKEEESNSIPE